MAIPIIHLDAEPQVDAPVHNVFGGRLSVSGPELDDSLLEGDERIGARFYTYRGGRFDVHPNIYERGNSLHKAPIKGIVNRWFTEHGFGLQNWHYQVSYAGSTLASSAFTRASAVHQCKRWIDQRIAGAS